MREVIEYKHSPMEEPHYWVHHRCRILARSKLLEHTKHRASTSRETHNRPPRQPFFVYGGKKCGAEWGISAFLHYRQTRADRHLRRRDRRKAIRLEDFVVSPTCLGSIEPVRSHGTDDARLVTDDDNGGLVIKFVGEQPLVVIGFRVGLALFGNVNVVAEPECGETIGGGRRQPSGDYRVSSLGARGEGVERPSMLPRPFELLFGLQTSKFVACGNTLMTIGRVVGKLGCSLQIRFGHQSVEGRSRRLWRELGGPR